MTKDLALLVGADQKWLSTTGFLDKIDANLKKAMALSGAAPGFRSAQPAALAGAWLSCGIHGGVTRLGDSADALRRARDVGGRDAPGLTVGALDAGSFVLPTTVCYGAVASSTAISPKKSPSSSARAGRRGSRPDLADGDEIHGVAGIAAPRPSACRRRRSAPVEQHGSRRSRSAVMAGEQRHARDHAPGHDELPARITSAKRGGDDARREARSCRGRGASSRRRASCRAA